MRVLVVHGPNLNLLGERQPEIYGTQTLAEIDAALMQEAKHLGIELRTTQHNAEGAIIDALHAAREEYDAVIINPGAYAHYSYAIADAIASLRVPVVEVHLSNLAARETHRRTSVTAGSCKGYVAGFGGRSYLMALRALQEIVKS